MKPIDRDPEHINSVLTGLGGFALHDIEFMAEHHKPIGGFILASCFIDQMCEYRFGKLKSDNYQKVIEGYFQIYKDLDLERKLRNLLVHHYSIHPSFVLTTHFPWKHLETMEGKIKTT